MQSKIGSHANLNDGYTAMTRTRRGHLAAFADFRLGTTQPKQPPDPEPAPCIPKAPPENTDSQSAGKPENPPAQPHPPQQASADKDVQDDRPRDCVAHTDHDYHDKQPCQPAANDQKSQGNKKKHYKRWFLSPIDRRKTLANLVVAAAVTSERDLPAFFKVSYPMPAMIGIDEEFRQRYGINGSDPVREQALQDAMRFYFNRMAYISALLLEPHRHDLDLNPVEAITENEREFARIRCESFIDKLRESKRQARESGDRDSAARENG